MHKVFISYHHANDQYYKNYLVWMGEYHKIFIDRSVDTGDIADNLSDQAIREKIRDDYLRDSTVTILLVGKDTKMRKHVDWEIYSSMIDGKVNKKSGILVVNLPVIEPYNSIYVCHSGEKETVYPDIHVLETITSRAEFERRYPYVPDRIIDNLLRPEAKVSVTSWSRFKDNPKNLQFLIEATFKDRAICDYDLRRPMRRKNS